MEKVKAGLRGLNADQKLGKGKLVLGALSGNPHFPNPVPTLAELDAACIELQAANIAAMGYVPLGVFPKGAGGR